MALPLFARETRLIFLNYTTTGNFRKFQELIGEFMRFGQQQGYRYNVDRIRFLIEEYGLTHRQIATACRCSERHVSDVVNNRVATARPHMKKRFKDGFRNIIPDTESVSGLFF